MNVAWKFIAVLALLFSLTALVLEIIRIQVRDSSSEAIRQEVSLQLSARERAMVDRLAPRVNTIRANLDLPTKRMQTIEDVVETIVEPVESLAVGKR